MERTQSQRTEVPMEPRPILGAPSLKQGEDGGFSGTTLPCNPFILPALRSPVSQSHNWAWCPLWIQWMETNPGWVKVDLAGSETQLCPIPAV